MGVCLTCVFQYFESHYKNSQIRVCVKEVQSSRGRIIVSSKQAQTLKHMDTLTIGSLVHGKIAEVTFLHRHGGGICAVDRILRSLCANRWYTQKGSPPCPQHFAETCLLSRRANFTKGRRIVNVMCAGGVCRRG